MTIDDEEKELVDKEALQAIGILIENCPDEMKNYILPSENGVGWISCIVERFVGKGVVRSSSSRKIFQKGYPLVMLLSPTEQLQVGKLVKSILSNGLLAQLEISMKDQVLNEPTQVEVLKIWGYLLLLLKERTLFKDSKFLNRLLAIVNKAFLHSSTEIQLQAFNSWRYFLCVICADTQKLIRHKQRLTIALAPSIRAYVYYFVNFMKN